MPLPDTRPSETDAAYLAGMIDGDGSMGIYSLGDHHADSRNGNRYYSVILSISNTDIGMLECIQGIWGGKIYSVENHGWGKVIHRLQWQAQEDVLTILSRIKPYLLTKCEQAEDVINYCLSRLNRPSHKAGYTEEERTLVGKVKSYNFQKGGVDYAVSR